MTTTTKKTHADFGATPNMSVENMVNYVFGYPYTMPSGECTKTETGMVGGMASFQRCTEWEHETTYTCVGSWYSCKWVACDANELHHGPAGGGGYGEF